MMNNRFGVYFYFKKREKKGQNTLPIYLRISASADRAEMATQRRWDPTKWNASAGRATGKGEEARSLNAYLDTLQAQVYEAHRQLIADRKEITADAIKMRATGKQEKGRTLIPIFKRHNDKVASLVNKDYAPGTLERYQTALSHTVSFLQWKYNAQDIGINELNFEFVTEFEYWLKAVQGCSHNTAVKYISNVRKIINICLRNGWLTRDPFFGYKGNKREVIRQVLTPAEIDTLINKSFVNERLSVIRDLFVFSCFTGLAYADIKKLKQAEIGIGLNDKDWIFTYRKKSEIPSHIPLLPEPTRILQRYQNHPLCLSRGVLLPVPSNQKMNAYLKEIADLCNINKKMTSHVARHTFATTIALTNGVPIETVSKILGHTNIKTTQLYAKIVDSKLSDDMAQLQNKLDARARQIRESLTIINQNSHE